MKIPSVIPGSPVRSWCAHISDIAESQLSDPVTSLSQSWMDRLRRSFRSSFRRREELQDESGGPAGGGAGRQWPQDEAAVKSNSCSFEVKYLGSVEVRLSGCLSPVFTVSINTLSGVRVQGNAGL